MNKLILIGAADSIGVPYSKDNKNNEGFFELIEKDLSKKYELISVNCFHMAINNDNDYISKLINNNYSIADIKKSQNAMLNKCKYSGIYPYIEMPKKFLNHYKVKENDKKIFIRDIIKNNDVIFIYSALINDLLKYKKLSLFKLLLPGKLKKELKKLDLSFVFEKIERNIYDLINLNKNIKIYIVGLFVPTKIPYIRKIVANLISEINTKLNELSNKYDNVFVINNENLTNEDFNNIDFHPNRKGHLKIYNNFCKECSNKIIK